MNTNVKKKNDIEFYRKKKKPYKLVIRFDYIDNFKKLIIL